MCLDPLKTEKKKEDTNGTSLTEISACKYQYSFVAGYCIKMFLVSFVNRRSSEIQGTALGKCLQAWPVYWAIQAGLLTPLTFALHCLSPLAAFTSGSYFLHNRRR